jgi:hypothetical protein
MPKSGQKVPRLTGYHCSATRVVLALLRHSLPGCALPLPRCVNDGRHSGVSPIQGRRSAVDPRPMPLTEHNSALHVQHRAGGHVITHADASVQHRKHASVHGGCTGSTRGGRYRETEVETRHAETRARKQCKKRRGQVARDSGTRGTLTSGVKHTRRAGNAWNRGAIQRTAEMSAIWQRITHGTHSGSGAAEPLCPGRAHGGDK